jgi:hypothetical protein
MHPTWMIGTQALRDRGLYSTAYPAAEDYERLRRMSKSFYLANLPEFLLEYSISTLSISMKSRCRQLSDRLPIQAKYFDPYQAKAWLGVARTLASRCRAACCRPIAQTRICAFSYHSGLNWAPFNGSSRFDEKALPSRQRQDREPPLIRERIHPDLLPFIAEIGIVIEQHGGAGHQAIP